MTIWILGLVGVVALLSGGALGAVWLTRWLAARAAEGLSVEELDAGLAIPMRDSDTRRIRHDPAPGAKRDSPGVEKFTTKAL